VFVDLASADKGKPPPYGQHIEMGAMKLPPPQQQGMKSKVDGSQISMTSPTTSISGDVVTPIPETPQRNSFTQVGVFTPF
jgi:hypothetical protein